MGGMGTLLYEGQFPGEMEGLLLLTPYVGDADLLDEIRDAGGLAHWQPGPMPESIDAGNHQRELWRPLQTWSRPDASRPAHFWLAYCDRDRLEAARPLFEPILPADHLLVRPGGHARAVWTPATTENFARIHHMTSAETSKQRQ